jgi:hypothetical protein
MTFPTDLPTRTQGSLGAEKTNRRRNARPGSSTSADEHNEAMDTVVAICELLGTGWDSGDGTVKSRLEAVEGGGGSGALIEWNGDDLTQFDAAITSGFTSPALSVQTNGSGKVLKFTATAASANAYYVRYFTAPVTMQSMTGRAWVIPTVRTAGDALYAGLAFGGQDVSPPLLMSVAIGTDNSDTTNAIFAAANGSNPGTGDSWTSGAIGLLTFGIAWTPSNGSDPPSYAFNSATNGVDASGFFAGIPGLSGFPAVDSEWTPADPNKVGIYIYAGTGGASNPVEIYLFDVKFEAR